LDNKRWKRVESVFHNALERPAGEREAFVRDACAGDGELFDEVMALLRADGAPHSLLEGRAADAVDATAAAGPPTLAEGTRIGPYQIVRTIGTGGMGVVYLAERADGQFEQRVALKLIKRGMDSDLILSRFHTERRILARLQHPNIASLLDGGLTEDGLPFFTMEYVDGQPITEYCDQRRLTVEERLHLFQSVCEAVQYAQGNLVVHRDLKPSNILVTNDGHVKLLDFGIARVLGEDDLGLTRSGHRVMTPAYASPEQVIGAPVTTASDVYSLGVVLYELLCGRHPHRDTTSTPVELERAIAETQVERPSRSVSRSGVDDAADVQALVESIAGCRRISPARLRRRLAGDLDNICLVALRKEPERRYSSPGVLYDDIRHHLSGQPVHARPDTFHYRFTKFVGRNRVAVAAAIAVVLLGAVLTTLYMTRLASERDRARLEATKAAEVSEFLSGLFASADPYTSRGETTTAREMLDKGRDRVHEELSGQPDVLADMLNTIGTAYGNLGVYEDAVKALKESIDLRMQLDGEHRAEAVATMVTLLSFLSEMGRYQEADSLGRRAIAISRDLSDNRSLAGALGMLGLCLSYQGRFDEAEPLFRESIDIWCSVEGPDSRTASPIMNNFGLMLHEVSRYAEADSMFKRALAIQEKEYGNRHPETATTRYNYAQLLADVGNLTVARAMWDEVLATDRALYPEGHPAIAFTLSAYGRLLSRIGDFQQAEKLQRESLEIRRNYHGDEHPDVAYCLSSLGRALYDQAYYDEAEALLRESLALHIRVTGQRHPVLGNNMNAIGLIQYDRGDYAAADTSFDNSLRFQRSVMGDKERNAMSTSLMRRARVLAATGRIDQAELLAREGLEMSQRLHGDKGPGVASSKVALGTVLLRAGRVAEAESLFADGLAQMRALESGSPSRPRDIRALIGIGRCRLANGDVAGAELRFREALDISRQYYRSGHPEIARAEIALARALSARGDDRDAERLLRSAADALTVLVLPGQIDLVEAKHALNAVSAD
jgi:serine/threonine-protein kinase